MSLLSLLKASVQKRLSIYTEDINVRPLVSNFKQKYGYINSIQAEKPVDNQGKPIPWFTYPAIEYLESLALSNTHVFEWGSGNSSAYFAARCLSIESIESNQEWFEYQKSIAQANQIILLKEENSKDYACAIEESVQDKYEIIIVDGMRRVECCSSALTKLREGGILILDNSDWYPQLCKSLRERNLIQIDFHGHGPINPYTWTTSIFASSSACNSMTSILIDRADISFYSKAGLIQVSADDRPLT